MFERKYKSLVLRLILSLAICISGLPLALYSQSGYYGSYETLPPDSSQHYIDLAKSTASAPKALAYINQALASAILHRNSNAEAKAYLIMAEIQSRQQQNNEAKASLRKCKQKFESGLSYAQNSSQNYENAISNTSKTKPTILDRSILRDASLALAVIYESENQISQALKELEYCQTVIKSLGTDNRKIEASIAEARIYSKLGQYNEAEKRLNSLLKKASKSSNPEAELNIRTALAENHQRSGNEEKANQEISKTIDLTSNSNMRGANLYPNNGLNIDLLRGRPMRNSKENVKIQNQIRANYDATNAQDNSYQQNISLGNAYMQNNQPDLAETYVELGVQEIKRNPASNLAFQSANQNAVSIPSSAEIKVGADAYRNLAESFRMKKELEKSLEYYKRYAILQDSVNLVHQQELEEAVEMSKVIGQNEERLKLLERERDLSDKSIALLQQDQSNQKRQIFTQNLIIGILVSFLLLGIIAAFILVKNTRARRRADKLLTLQSMSGQMNPHFIFNALNSVNEFISQNDERAANRYLSSFSRLMRKVMDDSRQTFIPLSEEISMLKLYLELEHARFREQFSYTFEVDPNIEDTDFELPPMMVQPYIENAIWHGLRYRKGAGKLHIHFQELEEQLSITISDDGIGIKESKALKTMHQKKQNSLGMKNIGTRIELMNEIYGIGMQVKVAETYPDSENPGTTVHLLIPQTRKGAASTPKSN